VFEIEPLHREAELAVLPFGGTALLLDRADEDSPATIAFQSTNCDKDYQRVLARGAEPIEPPTDRTWGPVRSAYIRGPGRLTFEIEEIKARRTQPAQ
jgi:hypothetical protein